MPEAVQERHGKNCASRSGKRCNCQRSYRTSAYDPRTKKNIYSGWSKDRGTVVKWRTQAKREIEAHANAGIVPGEQAAQLWVAWVAGAESGAISTRNGRRYKTSTLDSYKSAWTTHLKPEFGSDRLTAITRVRLQRWANERAAEAMPRSTLNNSLDPLRVLFRRAIKNGEATINPTTDLDLPAKAEEEMRIVSREQAAKLIAASSEPALWATAFYAGLRRSELRALRWDDIDFDAGVITVSRAWTQAEDRPKTDAGTRRIALAAKLREHLQPGPSADLVFGRTASLPFVASTVRAKALKDWKAAGLEPITLHQARHNFASFLIAGGANAKALSVVMGHASIDITFNRYGHLMPGAEQEVGRSLDAYLS
jgi:integrase